MWRGAAKWDLLKDLLQAMRPIHAADSLTQVPRMLSANGLNSDQGQHVNNPVVSISRYSYSSFGLWAK